MALEIIIIWLIGSIVLASAACVLAKHFGPAFLIAMFVGGIVTANAVVQKFVELGPWTTSAGVIAYSITFIVTDCISEFWGKKMATKVIWSGFVVYLMLVFTTQIALILPSPEFWTGQEAFTLIFGASWQVALASIVAYVVAQTHDVWAFHFWKKITKGKYLWLRNNLSTIGSQVVDTIIFFGIAFWGTSGMGGIILATIGIKTLIAIADTPFLYLIRWYYEKVKPYKKGKPTSVDVPVV